MSPLSEARILHLRDRETEGAAWGWVGREQMRNGEHCAPCSARGLGALQLLAPSPCLYLLPFCWAAAYLQDCW